VIEFSGSSIKGRGVEHLRSNQMYLYISYCNNNQNINRKLSIFIENK